ncbi:hypothetical protein ACFL2U_03760 [Patescibacteria group bacterium]
MYTRNLIKGVKDLNHMEQDKAVKNEENVEEKKENVEEKQEESK